MKLSGIKCGRIDPHLGSNLGFSIIRRGPPNHPIARQPVAYVFTLLQMFKMKKEKEEEEKEKKEKKL